MAVFEVESWYIAEGKPHSILSFDGKRWTTRMGSRRMHPRAIEITADGTVWAAIACQGCQVR